MDFISLILGQYRRIGNIRPILTDIKQKNTVNEIVSISTHRALNNLKTQLWGNTFPQNLAFLDQYFPTFYSGSLIPELKYTIASCIAHQSELIEFEALKNQYERSVLNGEFSYAQNTLSVIEKSFGESLWLIGSKLFLAEKTGGTEENWRLLSETCKEKGDNLVRLILEARSRLHETNITYQNYIKAITTQIDNLPVSEDIKVFLRLDLSIDTPRTLEEISLCLFFYTAFPVIDRFIMLNSILKLTYTILDEKEFKEVAYQIRHYNKAFPDLVRARNILILEGLKPLEENYINSNYFELIENVYGNNTINSSDFLENYFYKNFSFKHYVDQQAYFQDLPIEFPLNSLHRVIIHLVKKINKKDEDFLESLSSLKKLITQLNSFNTISYIEAFVDRENSERSIMSAGLRFAIDEPTIPVDSFLSTRAPNNDKIKSGILMAAQKYPLAYRVVTSFLANDPSTIADVKDTCTEIEFIYSRIQSNIGNSEEAIACYKNIYNAETNNYYKSLSFLELIEEYAKNKKVYDLVILIGSAVVSAPNFLHRIDLDSICTVIMEDNSEKVCSSIYTPIIFLHANKDRHRIYIALDDYLLSQMVERPSELTANYSGAHVDHSFLFLLANVCTIDVLKYSSTYSNITEVEAERLEILKYLSGKYDRIQENVVSEIIDLTQRNIIRKGLRNYNKGKFSLNTFQIRKYLSDNISISYNRFKLQEEVSKSQDLKTVDYEDLDNQFHIVVDLQNLGRINTLISLKDPAFISFKSIFNEVREIFLFSKEYGLDGILSTRIRHGILINHIKRVFLSLHLLSTKEDDSYQDVKYWYSAIPINGDLMNILQAEIKEFSKSIDMYCTPLRTDYIQIKTEKDQDKNNALLDFSINRETYLKLFAVIKEKQFSLSDFIEYVHSYLITHTKLEFERVRKFLEQTVTGDLRIIIDQLRNRLQEIHYETPIPELSASVHQASTNITTELKVISSWFQVSEEDNNLQPVSWSDIIHIAIKLSAILHPNYILEPKILDHANFNIQYTIGIVDIFKILLDNVINHSRCDPENLDLSITISYKEESSIATITIDHRLGETVDKDRLDTVLSQCKDNWNSIDFYGDRISKEGGSGLRKMKRILQYELRLTNNAFHYSIAEDRLKVEISFAILLSTITDE